jgi:Thioesterase-like superfamily
MADALFLRDGESFVPTELARGPWSQDALHGGPVAALLAGLCEALPQPVPMQPARLTVELLAPVPLRPLSGEARVLRAGRKVQLVEASLRGISRELARATLLFVRVAELPLPDARLGGRASPPPGPETVPRTPPVWDSGVPAYHKDAVEHRVVRGAWGRPGPCTDWIRLRVPVVAGEIPSPLQRTAAAADFGNGIGAALPYGEWRFINPDLTIHLQRLPKGEWVCLDAVTWPEGQGLGLAESELFDETGRLGRSLQSLLLERS